MDDPWYWDVDRIVDGIILMTYMDRVDMNANLGLTKLNERSTLDEFIHQMMMRSIKYRDWHNNYEEGDAIQEQNDRKRRLLAELAEFQPSNNHEQQPEPMEVNSADKPPISASSPVPGSEESNSEAPRAEEPPQKKRRIAPTTVTTNIDTNAIRNIPTAADDVLGVSSNALLAPVPAIDPSEAYLGMDAVTRIEIAELDSPSRDGSPTEEDTTVNFVRSERLPRGRQLQIHRLFKRHLLPKHTLDRLVPTKPDTVYGANDPNRDEVLPVYGDSESEYDSETWEEMEAESNERAAAEAVSTGLDTDQVNSIIDGEIQHLIDNWRGHRLPKLGRSAYKVWSQPRKRGYLRIAIENERRLARDLDARLAKYRGKILEQQFYAEAEVRSMCRIFEQTVDERETASWKVNVLTSKEPEKPTPVPRIRSKKPRKARIMGDESEVLTSGSEDDGLGDFIVDDDIQLTNDGSGSPMGQSTRYSPTMGSPVADGIEDGILDKHESESPPNGVQSSNTHAPSVSNAPRTPSKTQRTQPHVIDLTVTPDERPKSNGNSTTRRNRHSPTIPTNAPKHEGGSTQLSKKHKHKGHKASSSLVMDIADLDPAEHRAATELKTLGPKYLSTIFTLAREMKPDWIWKDFILPALATPEFPKPIYTDQDVDIIVAFRLLRLFHVWVGEPDYPWSQYKQLSEADKKGIVEDVNQKQEEFGRFVNFISTIADRFEWNKEGIRKKPGQGGSAASTPVHQAAETLSDLDGDDTAGEDINGDAANGSLAGKKKRRTKVLRNQEAQNLRDIDRFQMHEQETRRNQLRAQLAQLEASGAAIGSQRAMIINESKEEDEGFIYVHDEIAPRIKEHQVAGVRFMWNQVVAKSGTRQGCLLAHTMGLGKTMQIITLLVTIAQAAASEDDSIRSQIPENLRESKTLILCPPTLVNNWIDELLYWTPEGHGLGLFCKIESSMLSGERGPIIRRWAVNGGILVIGYSLLKQCMEDESLEKTLIEAPNLVVADEAHIMKNPKSQTHIATSSFKTKNRIALTGSPLANNVEEYHAMINWVAPNYLSDLREFRQDYANPIRDGLSVDSTPFQKRTAISRLHALKTTVGPKIHRMTIAALKHDIPPKIEFVLVVPLTEIQWAVYESYVASQKKPSSDSDELTTSKIFASLTILSLLCAHPNCFLKFLEQKSSGKGQQKSGDEANVALPPRLVSDQISFLRKTKDIDAVSHSWKIPMLIAILDESRRVGDAVLVFSQYLSTLDYLENILRMQKRTVQRIDGSTAINSRQAMVKNFNKNGTEVFLISTTAGGLGLNITGANRVVVFDFKFNPQHEQQAVGRAYRLGQTKPVFVYRFVCGGTFEDTLLNRSIFKMQLADRVVDKKNPIPKATHFGEILNMPSKPEQKDLEEYRGRDIVMDKILDSKELRPGLRAIILMDTFQEESIEDSELSQDENNEAQRLIAQLEARRNGVPYIQAPTVTVTQGHGIAGTSSQPANTTQGSITEHVATSVAVPSTNQTSNNGTSFSYNTIDVPPPSLPTQTTDVQTDRPDFGNRLQPTMGASTSIRQRNSTPGLSALAFKTELKRQFEIDADPDVQEKRRQAAQAVVKAVEAKESQRSPEAQRDIRLAMVEAAGSRRFVEAVGTDLLPLRDLGEMDAAAIDGRRKYLDSILDELWRGSMSTHSQGGDPEVYCPQQ
ncbi:hypothetical protein SLS62_007378 [Diatrype stigma]|uniref:Uncharacterized protein n=1 Tax=Diatrype stigma TaxID=117547 RepID=A0AAN9YMA9_9PEZI